MAEEQCVRVYPGRHAENRVRQSPPLDQLHLRIRPPCAPYDPCAPRATVAAVVCVQRERGRAVYCRLEWDDRVDERARCEVHLDAEPMLHELRIREPPAAEHALIPVPKARELRDREHNPVFAAYHEQH